MEEQTWASIDSRFLCKFTEAQFAFSEQLRPENRNTSFAALDCIQQASDATNLDIQLDSECSERIIQIKYEKPICDYELPECTEEFTCSTECCPELGEGEMLEYDYDTPPDLTCIRSRPFTFDPVKYACSCEDPAVEFNRLMRTRVLEMVKTYNKSIIESVYGAVGSYDPDGIGAGGDSAVDPYCIPLWGEANGTIRPQPFALNHVVNEYGLQANGLDLPIYAITGSQKVGTYLNSAGCFDFDGCTTDINWCYDPIVQKCLAAPDGPTPAKSPVLTFVPGAFKILEAYKFDNPLLACEAGERNRYVPIFADNGIVMQKVDVGTAYLGRRFEVDMIIEREKCGKKFRIRMQKKFAFWCPPAGAWCGPQNWKLLWDICCRPMSCFDLCD